MTKTLCDICGSEAIPNQRVGDMDVCKECLGHAVASLKERKHQLALASWKGVR
jgi:hypothetical protein